MKTLDTLREQIDQLDSTLLALIKKRIILMKAIGKIKKSLGKPTKDIEREERKLKEIINNAKMQNLPVALIEHIWKIFFHHAQEIEK